MPGAVPREGRAQPQRACCSEAPGSPTARTPRTVPGRLASSFSVEALLARPGPPARGSPSPTLPWPGAETWVPAYLGLGLYQPGPGSPMLGLRLAHFCTFGVTGLGLAHCPGLWSPPHWVLAQNLQDIERPPKRVRTVFNLEQLEELEKVFAEQHNLVGKKRAQLAARLNLTENQVRVWFQNRRVKYQKQQRLKLPVESTTSASPDEPSSTSIQRDEAEPGTDC